MIARACLLVAALLAPLPAEDPAAEASPWVDVTGPLGGMGGDFWYLAAAPTTDLLIASVKDHGLWGSRDGGATWTQLGAEHARPGEGLCDHLQFDPKNDTTFWASGMYHFGAWRSDDGGTSFTRLGKAETEFHCEGIAIDFGDAKRQTLLMALHEQERSLRLSRDGGATWTLIGDRLPAGTNMNNEPIIVDAKTWLVDCAGWKQGLAWGIFRSTDAGETWSKVSDAGAQGHWLLAHDGAIYWPCLWDGALVVSRDHGATWSKLGGPARGDLIELPNNRLVGLNQAKTQLLQSTDAGAHWTAFGEALPFTAKAVAWDGARRALIVFRNGAGANIVARWALPPGDRAFDASSNPLKVWNGEGYAGGGGWIGAGDGGYVKPIDTDHFDGKACLDFHVGAAEKAEGGWNWYNWAQVLLSDTTPYKSLSFVAKFVGDKKPTTLRACLNCGPNKVSSGSVDLLKACPTLLDGQWHQVTIPLSDLAVDKPPFDPRAVYELRLQSTQAAGSPFSIHVDAIAFLP